MLEAALIAGERAVRSQMQAHLSTDTGSVWALSADLSLCPGLYTNDLQDFE